MLKPDKSEIYINPDLQYVHFGNKLETTGPITSEIFKCQKSSGKHLMFSIGVKRASVFSDVEHISYDGQYKQNQCTFKNSNLDNADQDFEKQVAHQIHKQHHFIRSCLYLRVRDLGRTPLDFKPNQAACRMRAQTSGTIIMDGDYCFAKINRQQHLQLSVEVKQNCLNSEYLKSQNISAQDLDLVVNTWVAGDDSGVSSDLEYLRSIPVKVSLLPSSKLLSKSENLNKSEIEFPDTYNVNIHQGPFSLQNVGTDRFNIDYSLEVSNRSDDICVNGLPCTNVSNYTVPVAGQIELSEIINSQEEYIKSWPFLSQAPAQYQGVLKNSITPVIEKFKFDPRKIYQVTFKMLDPYEDYWFALNRIVAIKFNLPTPNESLDNIQSTPTTEVLGEFKALSSLPSSMVRHAISRSIEELNAVLRNGGNRNMWPPRYDNICFGDVKNCSPLEKLPEIVNLKIRFRVKGVDPLSGKMIFQSIQIQKWEKGQKVKIKHSENLPEHSCEPN
ncbi:MAG: hypothetical protein ACK5W9_01250 [Bdellovibrionales bacterium]